MTQHPKQFDVVVIGSGAAGLGLALRLAHTYNIAVLCKDNLQTSASERAQGGIAAVMSKTDSLDSHIKDTLNAGAQLCDPATVAYTVNHAKPAIAQLIEYGIQFTTTATDKNTRFHLTREGGHSHRRILHAADKTGAAVVKTLLDQVKAHQNIQCFTEVTALDLITHNKRCVGVNLLNNQTRECTSLLAQAVVLATGGTSMTYLHTTNPGNTSGDGISIAFNAGARIANMEFNQFHPTSFYTPQGETFLITEAMRGEGATLLLPNGTPFMSRYHAQGELAPRDVVSRAIHNEMQQKQLSHVFLDISTQPEDKIKHLFPYLYQRCLEYGIDITRSPIPVVPAAHYTCGGVITTLNGETDIPGLYAIGEVACTGLHGANRMASNSLLECLVFANSAAQAIEQQITHTKQSSPTPTHPVLSAQREENKKQCLALRKTLRTLMWDYVGIVRSNDSLRQAKESLHHLHKEFKLLQQTTQRSKELIELRNMMTNAKLIIESAAARKESRGTHYNLDYPKTLPTAFNTVITPTQHHDSFQLSSAPTIHDLIQPKTKY